MRYHLGLEHRHTELLYYGDRPRPDDLAGRLQHYNAANSSKPASGGANRLPDAAPLAQLGHRSPPPEHFALFATIMFIPRATTRVARHFHRAIRVRLPGLGQAKSLVPVLGHARATLVVNALGRVRIFDETGQYPRAAQCLDRKPVCATRLAPLST